MILYSVTVSVDTAIEAEWLTWMQNKHIPNMMATACFQGYSIQQLLDPPPQAGTMTYNIQYTCRSLADYEAYREQAAEGMQKEHNERFPNRFAAFRTILRQLDKGSS